MSTTEKSNGAIQNSLSITPDWLKAELFDDVLKEIYEDYDKITEFKAMPGAAAGENYATIMLRLEITVALKDGTTKDTTFMMKTMHDSDVFREMMKKTNIFENERTMYRDIVPEMEQMYRDAGVEINFGAKSYEIKTSNNYVLLENLCTKGFKNANRLECLDTAHTKCVLKKLSQWHAATATRVATKGPYPEHLTCGFFQEENREMFADMNKSMTDVFLKCMEKYDGVEIYGDSLRKLLPNIMDKLFDLAKVDPDDFNVLSHGDCWSNNMMFKYDDAGNIVSTYFVDFQIPIYGSVAHDLLYFLMSSTKLEDKISKFDYYIKYYHDNLIENLKLLKYPKDLPTLKSIHVTLIKKGFWGSCTATGVMGAVLVDPTEMATVENFLSIGDEGIKFKTLMYSNERYRKHISLILPWLYYRGALE